MFRGITLSWIAAICVALFMGFVENVRAAAVMSPIHAAAVAQQVEQVSEKTDPINVQRKRRGAKRRGIRNRRALRRSRIKRRRTLARRGRVSRRAKSRRRAYRRGRVRSRAKRSRRARRYRRRGRVYRRYRRYRPYYYPPIIIPYAYSTSRCERWHYRCGRRWGYYTSDYFGCMRYHYCD